LRQAARAKAFGFDVGYFDPYLTQTPPYLRFDDLGEMLAQADIVSIHCPLTRETHGLLGEAHLARMKKGAILINTARGAIVDTHALLKAIESGAIGGAALDVLPHEPPDPDDPLVAAYRVPPSWLAGRLILTPHAAFYSPESWYDLRHKGAETVRDYLAGGDLRNCVNAHLLPPTGATTR
jgi:phosphoglycerate dehydrogenase-like enzyme